MCVGGAMLPFAKEFENMKALTILLLTIPSPASMALCGMIMQYH